MIPSQERLVPTGVPGLDEILLGGVNRRNNILVEGAPGAGKTTLGLAFIHAGACQHGEPGVIISFELEPEKLLRDANGFNFRLQELIDRGTVRIIQTTPAVLMREFAADDGALIETLRSMGAKRLLVDGLTPLKLYAEQHHLPFREDMHTLIEGLTRLGVTTLMTAERGEGELAPSAEQFVFDTIISLTRTEHRRRAVRRLRIVKSRGQDFIDGEHSMSITPNVGIVVCRRAQSRPKAQTAQPTSFRRISTGVAGLDRLMDNGLYEGSVTMVSGISGTGKTVAGVQFLCANAVQGRKGLLVTLDEHPEQLLRNAQSLGFDLRGLIESGQLAIHYESPLELDLDVHFERVQQLANELGAQCIVFDSVAVYESSAREESADFLYALATHFKDRLATIYFNYESPELLGVSQISEELKGSHLVDNIILLSYVEISTRLRRAVTVPKARGSRNVQETREYVISEGGIEVIEEDPDAPAHGAVPQLPFSAYYGLLSRSPMRQSPAVEEAIAQGEALPPSAPSATQQ